MATYKILKAFRHLEHYFLEGEVKEIRADLVEGLTKEKFIAPLVAANQSKK